jgi:hypothetical protein
MAEQLQELCSWQSGVQWQRFWVVVPYLNSHVEHFGWLSGAQPQLSWSACGGFSPHFQYWKLSTSSTHFRLDAALVSFSMFRNWSFASWSHVVSSYTPPPSGFSRYTPDFSALSPVSPRDRTFRGPLLFTAEVCSVCTAFCEAGAGFFVNGLRGLTLSSQFAWTQTHRIW